jgi:hypothetical protein
MRLSEIAHVSHLGHLIPDRSRPHAQIIVQGQGFGPDRLRGLDVLVHYCLEYSPLTFVESSPVWIHPTTYL